MSDLISLFCAHCGQVSAAPAVALGRPTACATCGRPIQPGGPPPPRLAERVGHPVEHSLRDCGKVEHSLRDCGAPKHAQRARTPAWAWAALAGVVVGLIVGESVYLRRRQAKAVAAWADRVVAARLAWAQSHAAHGEWDNALRVLEEALAIEEAPTREQARPLLLQARQGQARALFDAARTALAARDVPRALTLLRDYRAHPHAAEVGRAHALQEELRRATSDRNARDQLLRMTDAELASLAATGEVGEEEDIRDPGVRRIFTETLRRHLPRELAKRTAAREAARAAARRRAQALVRQEARLRATRSFRAWRAFAAETRERLRELEEGAGEQEEAMEQFFRQTGIRDPKEQARLRKALRDGEAGGEALVEAVRRKATAMKQAFRRSRECRPGDGEVFDRLVDRELAGLVPAR